MKYRLYVEMLTKDRLHHTIVGCETDTLDTMVGYLETYAKKEGFVLKGGRRKGNVYDAKGELIATYNCPAKS